MKSEHIQNSDYTFIYALRKLTCMKIISASKPLISLKSDKT